MSNPAFRRALLALSHPLSMAAIVLLLLNDHVWRKIAPSWLTGKIGDAAWLIFAPFLFAAILAWFMPKRVKLVGRASIIITGLVFALIKVIPAFHGGFVELFRGLMGWAPATVLDPTDVLTLPALLIAWWIWQYPTISYQMHLRRGWLMLIVGALATMANVDPMADYGILCLVEQDARLAAISYPTGKSNQVFLAMMAG